MHATMANCKGKCIHSARQRGCCSTDLQSGGCPPSLMRWSASTAKWSSRWTLANTRDGLEDKLNVERMPRCALAKRPAVNPPLLLIPPARRGLPDRACAFRHDWMAVCLRGLPSGLAPINRRLL